MRHPHGETVIVHPRLSDGEDANGEPIVSWGEDIERPKCAVAPHVDTEEINDTRTMIVSGYDIYDTYDTPVGPEDEITVRGHRCKVDGEIARWVDPFAGRQSGSVIAVKRVEG